jgi:hypothetical protein
VLYVAAALTVAWGVAHLLATRGAVAGFGDLSADNRRILTMEWMVEGIALIATGCFVTVATVIDAEAAVSIGVYAVAVATLVGLAVLSLFTGFKVAFLPYRLCPLIFAVSAALIAAGAWL